MDVLPADDQHVNVEEGQSFFKFLRSSLLLDGAHPAGYAPQILVVQGWAVGVCAAFTASDASAYGKCLWRTTAVMLVDPSPCRSLNSAISLYLLQPLGLLRPAVSYNL